MNVQIVMTTTTSAFLWTTKETKKTRLMLMPVPRIYVSFLFMILSFPFVVVGVMTVATTTIDTIVRVGGGTKFTAIADVPYTLEQRERFIYQIQNQIPNDSDFFIHLGDLRNARDGGKVCTKKEYEEVATILKQSSVPVFVILGDNDWNDCPNPDEALQYWRSIFIGFESKYWNKNAISLSVTRQPGNDHNFVFMNRGSLFIGLNLVNGVIINQTEWDTRLQNQVKWTIELIDDYYNNIINQPSNIYSGSVVLFGHCNPSKKHNLFFLPLRDYIDNTLKNQLPILYMNGDQHEWNYSTSFYDQPSWLRITLSGLTLDPPTVLTIRNETKKAKKGSIFKATNQLFVYDRQIQCEVCRGGVLSFLGGRTYRKLYTSGKCIERCIPIFTSLWTNILGYECGVCPSSMIDMFHV